MGRRQGSHPQGLFCIEYSSWEPAGGPRHRLGPGSDSMWHQGDAARQAAPSGTSPGEPGKPSGPCTQPGPEPIASGTPCPARIRPPPQPKRKVVEKWSLFEALKKKLHQANQEGATDLLRDFLGRGDFKKFHTSFHIDLACSQVPSCGNWTLSFWAYLLTGQMENSTSSEKTYGDAMESFLHYIASEPEWEELFDLITASIDDVAKLVDKIPHGLYSELGWQVSFQQLETLLQKYYPRDPAYEEALGGNRFQRRDPPNSDEHELIRAAHQRPHHGAGRAAWRSPN